MRSFTQRQLLEEGFWDNFKTASKSAYKGAKFIGKHAAPKTAAGIESVKKYGAGLRDAMSSTQTLAKKNLEKSGYTMMPETWKTHGEKGDYFVVFAKPMSESKPVYETDPATGQPVIDPATGEPVPVIDPKTNEPQITIGEGKPAPFIVDKTGSVKQIHGREAMKAKAKPSAAPTSTPSLSGGPTTPTGTPPAPAPTTAPTPAPTTTPTPTTPPRRVSRGGPPGGSRRTPPTP